MKIFCGLLTAQDLPKTGIHFLVNVKAIPAVDKKASHWKEKRAPAILSRIKLFVRPVNFTDQTEDAADKITITQKRARLRLITRRRITAFSSILF